MAEEELLLGCGGCILPAPYVYHELTQVLIDAYSEANNPLPPSIAQAYDFVIRALIAMSGGSMSVAGYEVETDGDTFTHPDLATKTAIILFDGSQSQMVNVGFVQDKPTETITLLLGQSFYAGQQIYILYQ